MGYRRGDNVTGGRTQTRTHNDVNELTGFSDAWADPNHDPAGNVTFDSLHAFTYDAWNRMAKVQRAWREDANNALHTGSTIARMEYDGLQRRTKKRVTNCGDWDCESRFFWTRSWRLIETRNGSDATLSQYVRGGRYIDDLVQVAVNTTPAADDTCDASYTAMQNANFNVIGLADANGTLAERYEYSPYGQRTVCTKPGDNDALTAAPLYHSLAVTDGSGAAQPYTLNPFGHQGLYHDKEFALVQNRHRYLDPITGRFTQRDPAGYVDGTNRWQYVASRPVTVRDASGLMTETECVSYWKKSLTSYWLVRSNRRYWIKARDYSLEAMAAIGKKIHEENPVSPMESPRWKEWEEHRDWYARSVESIRAADMILNHGEFLKLAKGCYWMVREGCKCAKLRELTIPLVAPTPNLFAPKNIPGGYDPLNLILWLVGKGTSGAQKEALDRVGKTLDQVAVASVRRAAPIFCCIVSKRTGKRMNAASLDAWKGFYHDGQYLNPSKWQIKYGVKEE